MKDTNYDQQELDTQLSKAIQRGIDNGDIKEVHISSWSDLDGAWDDDDEA